MSYTQAERKEIADNIREYLKQEKKEEFYMMARGNEEFLVKRENHLTWYDRDSMNHASLFSGIGGFDLAAEWMGWTNLFNCEWEEFPRQVLKHHFPNAIQYGDIKELDATAYAGRVDILTGGFPCQPYSLAGKRKGKEDERHLWPEMLRVIRECFPALRRGRKRSRPCWLVEGWSSRRCALTWRLVGTPFNRSYFQLQVSVLPTEETESGLLLTPTTREEVMDTDKFKARMEKYDNGTTVPNLATQVAGLCFRHQLPSNGSTLREVRKRGTAGK
jgi:hypothetical protein